MGDTTVSFLNPQNESNTVSVCYLFGALGWHDDVVSSSRKDNEFNCILMLGDWCCVWRWRVLAGISISNENKIKKIAMQISFRNKTHSFCLRIRQHLNLHLFGMDYSCQPGAFCKRWASAKIATVLAREESERGYILVHKRASSPPAVRSFCAYACIYPQDVPVAVACDHHRSLQPKTYKTNTK